jgi:RNA polymerase sigma-70 factor (ECF subfamily)
MNDETNPYLSDPDVRLMLEFQGGHQPSFETLMRKYFSRLLNFIYRYVGDRETAEDLTQEVFICVYKSGPRYQPQSKFQTWVFTIARNLSLNELRRHKHHIVSLDENVFSETERLKCQARDAHGTSLDQELLKEERKSAIRAAINDLPESQRVAVLLRRYEQFSYEEIARTMSISVKAVKSLLNRAKGNLKDRLSKWVTDV